jgi:hypothetical protein
MNLLIVMLIQFNSTIYWKVNKPTKNWSAKACFYCSIKISLRYKYKLGDQVRRKKNIVHLSKYSPSSIDDYNLLQEILLQVISKQPTTVKTKQRIKQA